MDGMKEIGDKSIDMILCDLPYGITQCKWDKELPLSDLWKQYCRIIKDNGVICLFGQEPFSSKLRLSNLVMYKYDWVWEKTHPKGHLNAKKQPLRAHENISVFYKNQPKYNPQMTHGHKRKVSRSNYQTGGDGKSVYGKENRKTNYDSTDRYPRDVQVFSSGNQRAKIHPTQKPIELMQYLILTYTDAGDVVLDNCAGSCSSGIAAHRTRRKFIGFELDKHYYDLANERLKAEMAQMNIFDFMEGI